MRILRARRGLRANAVPRLALDVNGEIYFRYWAPYTIVLHNSVHCHFFGVYV